MKQISTIVLILSFFFLNVLSAKAFGKNDIVKFCSDKAMPITGKQFNKERANQSVLKMVAGKYSYPNGGALLLFTNNNYILKLPKNKNVIHGTSTDDLMASGGILGGCSKEQLSEAIKKNTLKSIYFKLLKRYRY